MLWVGLTGGIGAGKSVATARLAELGAAVVDADSVAREVVEPGTPGLDEVVGAFGRVVLGPDGALDREALGRLVFGDPEARARLNGIVHPRIGVRTAELTAEAEQRGSTVLVHDVPLLVESRLAPAYHLVTVVEAPHEVRLDRLTRLRGMTAQDAGNRIAAQASDEQRRAVADVVLGNGDVLAALHRRVDALWADRIAPYATNLQAGRAAPRGPVRLVEWRSSWLAAGERLAERLRFVCGPRAVGVQHIGSTAVPGLAGRDVLDLQVEVASWPDVAELAPALTAAGFPVRADVDGDPPRPEIDPDPLQWRKRVHRSADPGRPANVHVRPAGSAGARCAVALRDLLRHDGSARERYAAEKRRLAARHADDVDAYAEAKTPVLVPLLLQALAPESGD